MDYRENVRVIWPGEASGVVARAVNLSPAGILVDAPTPTPCAVGSDVLCDVTLPRGPRLLRGRVAHRRLLSSAKVGMGIEFVELSPREVAELRDAIDESAPAGQPAAQKVKVRFAGTDQVVRARAYPTDAGFRLATTLPFLKRDTEVDIALSPDASVSARGWVSMVALERDGERGEGSAPRLLIDVRVDSAALTPVVATLGEAVPEHVWEPDEVGATSEVASFDVAVEQEEEAVKRVPTIVTAAPPLPPILEAAGSSPMVEDFDHTEIVPQGRPPGRWRALGGGMIAGTLGLVAFMAAIVLMKTTRPDATEPAVAPVVPAVAAPEPSAAAPAPEPMVAAPAPAAEPIVAEPKPAAAPEQVVFEVPLKGSNAGARRYPLRDPDGVAFNLPRAHAGVKVGTYHPDVRGLKTMWVRELPGGGAHLRFFFTAAGPPPRVELESGVVRVTAR